MTVGAPIDTFDLEDISIADLILDDLAGYKDMLNEIDENILDRQATIVLYEIYRTVGNIPAQAEIPIQVKRYVAAHAGLRLIPSLRTFIAKNEIRGDTSQVGAVTRYDQLANLEDIAIILRDRTYQLQNEIQLILADSFALGPAIYDLPDTRNSSETKGFATLDPWRVGLEMYSNN